MISNKEITKLLLAYRAGTVSEALFYACLVKVSENAYKYLFNYPIDDDKIKGLIKDMADMLLAKSERFDENRGNFFNFCTTIALCRTRQEKWLREYRVCRPDLAKHAIS